MPVVTDPNDPAYGTDVDDGTEGGALRKKLEDALARDASSREELRSYRIKDKLTELNLNLVKPEDLAGTELEKIEDRAKEIQAERAELQKVLLRDALVKQGITGDQLEEQVAAFSARASQESPEAEAIARAQSLGSLGSETVPTQDDSKLHGIDAIKGGLEKDARKRGTS